MPRIPRALVHKAAGRCNPGPSLLVPPSEQRLLRNTGSQLRSPPTAKTIAGSVRPWHFSAFFGPQWRTWAGTPDWPVHYPTLQPIGSWGNIPEADLPEPWSCNWRRWDTANKMKHIISLISKQCGVELRKPLLYRFNHDKFDWHYRDDGTRAGLQEGVNSTVFLGVDSTLGQPQFYFYDAPALDLFRFEQNVEDAASAVDFVETADWSRIMHAGSLFAQGDTKLQGQLAHRKIFNAGNPALLRDLHEGPWGFQPRGSYKFLLAFAENPAIRDWCHIPESQLPPCWSCEWAYCGWSPHELHSRYNLSAANPIMFHIEESYVVLLESGGVFYLYMSGYDEFEQLSDYYKDILGPSPPEYLLFRFDGVYTSIADFLGRADWTKMALVAPSEKESSTSTDDDEVEVTVALGGVKLPMTDDGGPLHIATPKHDLKRTMWDMYRPPGTWGFAPRFIVNTSTSPPTLDWDQDEDSLVPSPWTMFDHPDSALRTLEFEWLFLDLPHQFYTRPLKPVMFRAFEDQGPHPVVLSDAEGKYYLYDELYHLWEFEGSYASHEDFVREADWDMMEGLRHKELNWGPALDESDSVVLRNM
ncbi:hypothetical protein B0H16DRAFT_1774578 [Mycena metata]|uniref:Uncharacterized protein n=1 Tax=Mycena metata TaxID=1033252 RepID=A0AAD7JRR5_9AGAR|nr:hypothetical protein B0H16DRAFT_1774578 [Mycena metata]